MTAQVLERTINLAGCGNFRDLGGYQAQDGRTVRWRILFRSDALIWLTHEDLETLRDLGIRLVAGFDLRTGEEVDQMHRGVIYETGNTTHHHLPFFPTFGNARARMREIAHATGQVGGDNYLELLAQAQPCFRGLFEKLADLSTLPAAYYCAAGKDRTGMVTALLLRTLGVSDEQIIEDYALTDAPTLDRILVRRKALGIDESEPINWERMKAHPTTMEHFLAGFDRLHGSVEEFLLSCGVTRSTIERVRQNLLEG
jgi:protein-tyrosine phosphatase